MVEIFIFVILSSIQSIVSTDIQLQQLEKMVNKLYDTMSIVLKENVKYRKLVKDLEGKVLAQEGSIRQLQEKCQLVNDSLLRDTEDPNFEKNQAIVEENDINITSIMNENLHKINTRLGIDAGHGSHSNVAFFSYMDHDLPTPSPDHTLVFDVSPTDTGNHYNKFTGIFTVSHSGTYVFTWTSYCVAGGYTYLQAVVNNVVLDSSYCNAAGAQYHRSITGTVVAHVNQSDAVFIRTHPTGINQGEVVSSDNHRTTFAGWLLF